MSEKPRKFSYGYEVKGSIFYDVRFVRITYMNASVF